jgi:hypothetical protein
MVAETPIYFSLVLSIVVALAYGLIGYANALAADNTVKFEKVKFLTTLIISLVVGLILWYQGIEATLENAATWFAVISSQAGIVYFVNKIVSMLLNFSEPETPTV